MTKELCRVFWTQTAQQDLKRIIEYIAADSNHQARKVYLEIKEKAENMRHMPLQGRVVPELESHHVYIYRELLCPPWRIIYKTEDQKVWVLAVIDGRRNVEDILLERLL